MRWIYALMLLSKVPQLNFSKYICRTSLIAVDVFGRAVYDRLRAFMFARLILDCNRCNKKRGTKSFLIILVYS